MWLFLLHLLFLLPASSISTSICPSAPNFVGCVEQAKIASDKTYLVEFDKNHDRLRPQDVCIKTCEAVYSNASLALVSSTEGLACHCGLEGAVESKDDLGPEIFCEGGRGGVHRFKNGLEVAYFSLYCLSTTNATSKVSNRIARNVNATEMEDETAKEILKDMWYVLMRNNIIGVVVVGLLIIVIVLVVALLVFAYFFIDHYERTHENSSRSLFYRKLSGVKKPFANDRKEIYGATNRAFEDPTDTSTTPEVTVDSPPPKEPNGPGPQSETTSGKSTFYGWVNSQGHISEEEGASQESGETELAEETKSNGNRRQT